MSTSGLSSERNIRAVPISSIQKEPRATNGVSLDPDRVAAFSDLMRSGAAFPPIEVRCDDGTYWLVDGLHRLIAAEQAGIRELLCEVHAGTFSDAQWDSYASRANAPRVSPPEILLALVLRHPIAAALNASQIASHLGVAVSFVQYWRKRAASLHATGVLRLADISDEVVRKAISYMRANLGSDLSVPKLARQIGVSASHLSRRFRLATLTSPKAVLMDLRMERAWELLSNSDLTLKQIAAQLTYGRADEFSRAFARVHGIGPSAWRQARVGSKRS
jgi:AraC-like DNA-binding protein